MSETDASPGSRARLLEDGLYCGASLSTSLPYGIGLGLLLGRFPRWAQPSRAAVAAVFDIVVLGKRRDHGGAAFDLADAAQDDLRPAIVGFNGSADFDGASGEAANVAHIFQVVGEYDDREGTGHLVFTEIEEVHTFGSDFNAKDFPFDAFRFADVLSGLVDGDAFGGACGTEG
jgi:hypothetical protein